ncbi:MAG TPA: histidine phosphatase family protein [Nocardioidaceae bacterium]|nr:histidine phosphatase family protein [Nocardioidaceae bacterium]
MTSRRLILMRHAKAEPFASTDRERLLTARGRKDAVEAGAYLAGTSMIPDHAVISSAVRTRATWDAVAEGSGSAAEVQVDESVFTGSSPEVVLDVLRTQPDDARVVMFVGHNPAVAQVVHLLDDGNADPDAMHGLLTGYPVAALTVLEVEGPWSGLAPGGARIVAFHVGKG